MALVLQDLSESSSDGERHSEYDVTGDYTVSDVEIAQALHGHDETVGRHVRRTTRVEYAIRFITIMVVVGAIAALAYVFYDGPLQHSKQEHLAEELEMVKAFVQYEPETFVHVEELPDGILKITDPPPE